MASIRRHLMVIDRLARADANGTHSGATAAKPAGPFPTLETAPVALMGRIQAENTTTRYSKSSLLTVTHPLGLLDL